MKREEKGEQNIQAKEFYLGAVNLVPECGTCCPLKRTSPFFKYQLEFGNGPNNRVQGRVLVLGHRSGHGVPVCTPFLLVNSVEVLCFILAAKLMSQNGV